MSPSCRHNSGLGRARTSVKLKLPNALRRLLERKHKLKLLLTAEVKDAAGRHRAP